MKGNHKGAVGAREARRRAGRGGFDTTRQHATENRLAFVWRSLPVESPCQGTVWIHVDGTCECDSELCADPFAAVHPLPARHACAADKPVKGRCSRCARATASLPSQLEDPLFWVNVAKRFLPADQQAALDAVLRKGSRVTGNPAADAVADTPVADTPVTDTPDGDPDGAPTAAPGP